ncbi:ATP-binding protein [Teredinibacter sp. KSP-S5-2]|uniref:ATP-binding protein n=1 Tax=Teredinibacter sp. KSP-S5-2 TaxID=3034506 RepID=UPI0029350F04|nr:transporter substrate-binding domain-containing protein [Teredinibacter sp. KSP-S5-2]WNO09949.1 transporter substrate-binding domain-containing protein [Teredinibacter sp. KSP-S5-2]
MKKIHAYLICIFIALLSPSSFSQSNSEQTPLTFNSIILATQKRSHNDAVELTKQEQRYLNALGKIRLCVDPNWLPHEKITDDGQHIGIFADVIALISQRIRTPIELYPTNSWQHSLTAVENGECHLISGLNRTKEREKYLDFSIIFLSVPMIVAGLSDKPFIENLSRLNGKKVASVKGYRIATVLAQDYPEIHIEYYPSVAQAIEAVAHNKVYAAIGSMLGISYQVTQQGLSNVKILAHSDYDGQYRIGIGKSYSELTPIINRAIASISTAERNSIIQHWVPLLPSAKADYSAYIKGIIVLVTLFAILFFRYKETLKTKQRLEKANQQLHTAHCEQEQLIKMLAHEYRTPLSIIQSSLRLLRHEQIQPNIQTRLNVMSNAAQRMQFIVDNSLNIHTHPHTSGPHEASSDLSRCIQQTIDFFQSTYPEYQLDVRGVKQIKLAASDFCIRSCLDNVITNAIKYGHPQQEAIGIHIRSNQERCFIRISDKGFGIHNQEKEKIFDRFFRGSNAQKIPGTGLGLNLSRELVHKFGGTLALIQTSPNGSIFELTLPHHRG